MSRRCEAYKHTRTYYNKQLGDETQATNIFLKVKQAKHVTTNIYKIYINKTKTHII